MALTGDELRQMASEFTKEIQPQLSELYKSVGAINEGLRVQRKFARAAWYVSMCLGLVALGLGVSSIGHAVTDTSVVYAGSSLAGLGCLLLVVSYFRRPSEI